MTSISPCPTRSLPSPERRRPAMSTPELGPEPPPSPTGSPEQWTPDLTELTGFFVGAPPSPHGEDVAGKWPESTTAELGPPLFLGSAPDNSPPLFLGASDSAPPLFLGSAPDSSPPLCLGAPEATTAATCHDQPGKVMPRKGGGPTGTCFCLCL